MDGRGAPSPASSRQMVLPSRFLCGGLFKSTRGGVSVRGHVAARTAARHSAPSDRWPSHTLSRGCVRSPSSPFPMDVQRQQGQTAAWHPTQSATRAGNSQELTVDDVEAALYRLYFDPDMERKNAAQKWLGEAQASAQAWHFCWTLLGPTKVPEVQFFGASTLHTKISSHWSDLPAEQHEQLRAQLLSHILHFSSGPKMVLTRLCVALASMALNLIPHVWSQPVADMVRAFRPQSPEGAKATQEPRLHCLALLELLVVLPEEFRSSRLTRTRRAQLREALAGEWTAVCPLLRQLLQSRDSSAPVKEKVLRCLSSWVGLDVPLGATRELVRDCFATLSNPELFDTAVETIVNAISQPDCRRYGNALMSLMPRVLGLHDQLRTAARAGDAETSHGICRIAVAMGETHSRVLLERVERWQEFLALVNMILFCTGIPGQYPTGETTSSLTLTFWYTLQDDILSFEEEKQAIYLQVYRPVYFQLVDVLLHKSRYPSQEDYNASWSSDDKEQFRIYRVDIADTLMYVYEMLGAELLGNLYERLGGRLTDPQQAAGWQETEALLFGFQSIAETIDVNYSDVIPGLIGLIPRIDISNVTLADTVVYTIGARTPTTITTLFSPITGVTLLTVSRIRQCCQGSLAEWLADHPLMLGATLPTVLRALARPELSVSSVSTLKRICRECRHDLGPYARDVLAVSQDVLMKEIHKSSQCAWLMQALGFLLSALPADDIPGKLRSLVGPHVRQLDALARQAADPAEKAAIVRILAMLSGLFGALDVNGHADGADGASPPPRPSAHNPVAVVLQQLYTLIQNILSKWLEDSEVVEAVCALFRESIGSLGPLVAQLSETLGQAYSSFPQASVLDLASQMVPIFAGDERHISSVQSVRDHPDVAESFMYLHAQILKRKPDFYLDADHLDVKALFYCGILSLQFPETATVKAASVFFTEFLPRCEDAPSLGEALQRDGKLLTETILQAVGGGSPRGVTDFFSEVLLSLSRHFPVPLSRWLSESLRSPGFPSAHVSAEQKHNFAEQLLGEQSNKRGVKEMVKEFSLICRGLQGSGRCDH
ncbi:importin-13-like isoform X2 [Phyllopteryx taeniolatus]|uniref:importin-13-like isoform X2 n=1 Tax=Phyllopteryx taeniolatus TaxID=161469 RepID=UPI002AD213F7|nr:importin-13-like isoform X2 [Phyllopteryx taeniolatus]